MVDEDKIRDLMLQQLEEEEWDMSESALNRVAGKLSHYFKSDRASQDFVEENASYLFSLMEDKMESDSH